MRCNPSGPPAYNRLSLAHIPGKSVRARCKTISCECRHVDSYPGLNRCSYKFSVIDIGRGVSFVMVLIKPWAPERESLFSAQGILFKTALKGRNEKASDYVSSDLCCEHIGRAPEEALLWPMVGGIRAFLLSILSKTGTAGIPLQSITLLLG